MALFQGFISFNICLSQKPTRKLKAFTAPYQQNISFQGQFPPVGLSFFFLNYAVFFQLSRYECICGWGRNFNLTINDTLYCRC